MYEQGFPKIRDPFGVPIKSIGIFWEADGSPSVYGSYYICIYIYI